MSASFFFNSWLHDLVTGAVDPSTDSIYMMLVSVAPSRLSSASQKRSDIASEVVGTGYTAGGQACAVALALNDGLNQETLTTAVTTWPGATITAVGAVLYVRRGGSPTLDNLYAYLDFGGTVTSTNGNFTVNADVLTLQG